MKCSKCGKECYVAYSSNMGIAAGNGSPAPMVPYCSEHALWQASANLELRAAQLEAELIAERARRIKAEEVVDEAFGYPFIRQMAAKYRAQYPRMKQAQEGKK